MSSRTKDRLRLVAVAFLICGFIISGVSGIVPPTSYDPSTLVYLDAMQPMLTQVLLYQHRHECWIIAGSCFAASAALALIVKRQGKKIANHTSEDIVAKRAESSR